MTLVLTVDDRYDRQSRITWWDQKRLASARVLVVGAGALGNEVVKNLALMGVGSIVVVDFDTIEASNLARCVFFRDGDDGRDKVEALCERVPALNADVEIFGIKADVRSMGTGVAMRADVMVGALDNRVARLYLNRLAWRTGRAWVDGAIEGLHGLARVFTPPNSCYECTLNEADFAALAHRQSCRLLSLEEMSLGRTPTTATGASIIGGLQAQEVVKLLHRDRPGVNCLDGAIVVDGANNDAYPIRYPFDEECLAHHTFEEPVRIEHTPGLVFADLVRAVGFDSGVVELGCDHIESWTCPECDERSHAGVAASLVTIGVADCPRCGAVRQFDLTTSVGVPSDQAGLGLDTLGVRSDEVLAVRDRSTYRYVWVADDSSLPGSWA